MLRWGATRLRFAYPGMQQGRQSELLGLLSRLPVQATGMASTAHVRRGNPADYPFEAWSLVELKRQCRTLGLVTSRSKGVLIEMLRVFYQEHSEVDMPRAPPSASSSAAPAEGPSSPNVITISDTDSSGIEVVEAPKAQRRRRKAKESPVSSDAWSTSEETQLEQGLEALSLGARKLRRRKSASSSESEVDPETAARMAADLYGSEPNAMDEAMCSAIYQDEQLYQRILLLEPVPLDEMMGVGIRAQVLSGAGTKERARMRTWLDTQGICFYEGDLGTR